MPAVEKVSGGRVYVRKAGREFDRGDRVDVSEATAAYLCEERGDFERVDAGAAVENVDGVDDAAMPEPEPADESDESDENDESGDVTDDASGDVDSSFDADEWLERDYQDRADLVSSGNVDDHLETILEIETSETVKDAVNERQEV